MVKYTGRAKQKTGLSTNQGRNMSGTAPRSSFARLTANRSGGNYQTCGPVLYHGNVVKTNTSENSLCLPPAPVGRTLAGGVGVANVPRLSMSSTAPGDFRRSTFEAGNGLTRTGRIFSVTAADAQGNYNFSGNVSVPNGIITGDVVGNLSGNSTGLHTGNVTGDVTGNVAGDVTGNLTGNSTGLHIGNVTGDVTGNLTGNVTGDVNGNADTATFASNAATATDATNAENAKAGSALESKISGLSTNGAIFTGSVTGLPTPTLPSDAASKSYVDDLELGKEIWAKNYKKVINLTIRQPSDSTFGTPDDRNYCTGWVLVDENDDLFIISGAHCVLAYNEALSTQAIPNSRYTDKLYVNIFDENLGVFRIIRGTVVAGDGAGDVALIQLYNTGTNKFYKASDLGITEGFEFGKSRESPPGSKVFVISNPGVADMFSISSGVVRDNVFNNGQSYVLESLLHSASIDGGSSGAPILDKDGRIIGMHTWSYTTLTNMSGGITQFMLEGIVKKMIVARNDTPQLKPEPYENDKSFFNLTAYELNNGNIARYGLPGMDTNPAAARYPAFAAVVNDNKGMYYYVNGGEETGPVAQNLVVKNEDVVFELTYTPSEQAKNYDPNYVAPNTPVTLTIGAFPKVDPSSPIQVPATSALWWIDNNNVNSVYIKVYDVNGALVERHAAGWDVQNGLKFMPHTVIDTPLGNVSMFTENSKLKKK